MPSEPIEERACWSRVSRVMHVAVVSMLPVSGGYSGAMRRRVTFADGTTAFLKLGTTPDTARFLRDEMRIYEHVKAPFIAHVLGWDDDPNHPLLLLEDLSHHHWPPPWTHAHVDSVLRALDALHSIAPPAGLDPMSTTLDRLFALSSGMPPNGLRGWERICADPDAFLALGLCTRAWLDHCAPQLVAAERAARVDGTQLVHFDVRSDNLCIGERDAILVDWNWASVGNGDFDVAFWLPSLASEGGPRPEEILPKAGELAALVSGFFASQAGLAPPEGAPGVRVVQRSQWAAALPWVVAALGLPTPG